MTQDDSPDQEQTPYLEPIDFSIFDFSPLDQYLFNDALTGNLASFDPSPDTNSLDRSAQVANDIGPRSDFSYVYPASYNH
jgi:hypothetical protein